MGAALFQPVYDNTCPPPLLRAAFSIVYSYGIIWGIEGLSCYPILLEFELPRYRALLSPEVSKRGPRVYLKNLNLIPTLYYVWNSSNIAVT